MKLFWKAAISSAVLCTLFVVVYFSCNWITGMRTGVGSFYFAWERGIPFVPWMIVPYMSIDLFFIAGPFLARSERELRVLAWRIVAAILVAGACFLVMPLKFAFERPHVEGILGAVFNNFREVDLPFNEFPSLHIALLVILADLYWKRLGGMWRWIVAGWFLLIGVSPVLTYQHHVIDIAGGLVLGVMCVAGIGGRRGGILSENRGDRI